MYILNTVHIMIYYAKKRTSNACYEFWLEVVVMARIIYISFLMDVLLNVSEFLQSYIILYKVSLAICPHVDCYSGHLYELCTNVYAYSVKFKN